MDGRKAELDYQGTPVLEPKQVEKMLSLPAKGLLACIMCIGPFAQAFVLMATGMALGDSMTPPSTFAVIVGCIVVIGFAIALLVAFFGAFCMANVVNYRLSFASAVIGSCLCIPFAIMALNILRRPPVRQAFMALDRRSKPK